MSAYNEYSKLVRIKNGHLNDKGFKATLTLPANKTLPRQWDYINFYVGINGYECGISCRNQTAWKENGVLKWRVFMNGDGATTYGNLYADGATVTISIEKNADGLAEFKVNGSTLKVFSKKLDPITNAARLVFASSQDTGYTPPLDPWSVLHDQVRAYEMKYKDSNGNWVAFTTGSNVSTEEWPLGVATPDGKKYIVDKTWIGNADVYASVKNL
ncbi:MULTISPECIES: hypothetical protein [Paenibacillus]|uniref:Uncharacterized protein n=1 Tax=Paenibacillus borealis TaxID=160799 RepID=A0ABX3GWV7_PAEBO|nr:hypothetical protein [Paenibacillus borealis]OMD39427.1 hypothetical protein BSK56_29625 [Paenibacillus borealis]